MPIHTDDLLEKLDRVLSQPWIPPATHCGWCKQALTGREASLDFCEPDCQAIWHSDLTDGQAPDGGLGGQDETPCPCAAHSWIEVDIEASHLRLGSQVANWEPTWGSGYIDRLLSAAARWLRVDPDR